MEVIQSQGWLIYACKNRSRYKSKYRKFYNSCLNLPLINIITIQPPATLTFKGFNVYSFVLILKNHTLQERNQTTFLIECSEWGL